IQYPRSRAVLLSLPFALALAAARAGFYPYGGTRHDIILALFAIPGIAIGVDLLGGGIFGLRSKMALLLLFLMVYNIHAPACPPVIRPKHQQARLIHEVISICHSPRDGSVILAH